MSEEAPGWIEGPLAQGFIEAATWEERLLVYRTIASILRDPSVDGVNKFELSYFPFTGRNVRQCMSGHLLVVYRAYETGSLYVYNIFRQADLSTPEQQP